MEALLNAGIEIHCLRDLTRGGLATTLNEIASDRNVCIRLEEALIPVDEVVQGACEILGLDPLYVANEGRFAVFVPEAQAPAALEIMSRVEVSQGSVRVGRVEESPGRTVILQSRIGGNRVVDMLSWRATAQNLLRANPMRRNPVLVVLGVALFSTLLLTAQTVEAIRESFTLKYLYIPQSHLRREVSGKVEIDFEVKAGTVVRADVRSGNPLLAKPTVECSVAIFSRGIRQIHQHFRDRMEGPIRLCR